VRSFGAALSHVVPVWSAHLGIESPINPVPVASVVVAEVVVRVLAQVAGSRGVLVVLEDLHWADPETLLVLRYAIDHLEGHPVGVLMTGRPTEHGLWRELCDALERAGRTVVLEALDVTAITEMAEACLEVDQLPHELVAALLRDCDGVPLFVEDLLHVWQRGGALVVDADGEVVIRAPLATAISESFAGDVRRRVESLGQFGYPVLAAMAMGGLRLDTAELAGVVGAVTSEVIDVQRAAVGQHLLESPSGPFRHALTREAIRTAMPSGVRHDLAARLLKVLGERPELPGERIAELAELAGQNAVAVRALVAVGRAHLRRGGDDTGLQQLRRAVDIAQGPEDRATAECALAEGALWAGRVDEAEASAESLSVTLRSLHADGGRRGSARLLAARAAAGAGRWQAASDHLQAAQALAHSVGRVGLAAEVDIVAASIAIGRGTFDDALRYARAALAAAERADDPPVACEALEVAGRVARSTDAGEARMHFDELLARAERAGLDYWITRGLYQLGTLDLFETLSTDRLERARAGALRTGAMAMVAELDLELSAAYEGQFKVQLSREAALRCAEVADLLGLPPLAAAAHVFVAVNHAKTGDRRAVEASARDAMRRSDSSEVLGSVWGDCRAYASLAREDRVRALADLEAAAAVFSHEVPTIPRPSLALRALLAAVSDTDLPDPPWGATAQLCLARGMLHLRDAVRAGRAGRREDANQMFEEGMRTLRTAPWHRRLYVRLVAEAAITDKWGEPLTWLADCERYFGESGNQRLAVACRTLQRRAGVRVARPGPAGVVPTRLRRAGVTGREAELLDLLAAGESNSHIAERLALSRRTVEHHVASLLRKLGCCSRAELIAYAHREEPE
jgi:DNA-binding CsgD family transcriptional regulator